VNPYSLAPPESPPGPLAGVGVIVTRPARAAGGFARKLGSLGATPLVYPAIVILPPADRSALERAHAELASYSYAVFVSANAVEFGAPDASRWPGALVALAPGPGTAEALADAGIGIRSIVVPTTTFDSEGLLALPQLADVKGKRVVIFRGDGGRDLLGDTLQARGARVDCVGCYRRAPPPPADGLALALREGRAQALTLTSSEGADNLWAALDADARTLLARIPAFVPHPRIAARVRELGLQAVETGPGDAGLVAGLVAWFGQKR
jgi:uroporphyrinogen-III synthase